MKFKKPLRIVTYATDCNHPGLKTYLEPSCNYHGLELTVLSRLPGQKAGEWKHRQKDKMLALFLESVDDDQLILSTDAYDAWFMAEGDEILDKYRSFDRPLVFSAERNCWPPDPAFLRHYPASPTTARYLNTGGLIGPAGVIKSALQRSKWTVPFWKHRRSNQYIWSKLYLRRPDMIALDHDCRIFYCAGIPGSEYLESYAGRDFRAHLHEPALQTYMAECIMRQLDINNDRIVYKYTGERPCHLHFNGPTAAAMDLPMWDPLRPWLARQTAAGQD